MFLIFLGGEHTDFPILLFSFLEPQALAEESGREAEKHKHDKVMIKFSIFVKYVQRQLIQYPQSAAVMDLFQNSTALE